MKTTFRRLVRFKATDGTIKYGEAGEQVKVGDTIQVYTGDQPWALEGSGEKAEIAEVQCYIRASLFSLVPTHPPLDSLPTISRQHLLWHWLEL
jgi:hypothetical protein